MRTLPLLLILSACSGQPSSKPASDDRPDILLITLDTTRADRIGAYGDPKARTPNIDALAQRGALFRDALTTVPLTLPAHTSLFSSRWPVQHVQRDNGGRVNNDIPLLAEQLLRAGYHTAGFVGSYVLDGSTGLNRGFQTYFDRFHPKDLADGADTESVERPAREVVAEALNWWEETKGPRFGWVHLFDAHRPYVAPPDWPGDAYRGEIFSVDRALAVLLDTVGPDTLVVVTGDHGENLWDGGELEHGVVLTRSVLRVPLIVRPPGGLDGSESPTPRAMPARPDHWAAVEGIDPAVLDLEPTPDAPTAARVVETPVSIVDIAPTILAYVGLPCAGCEGQSLRPAIEGAELQARVIYAETVYPFTHYGWSPSFYAQRGPDAVLRSPDDRGLRPLDDPWWQSSAPVDETLLPTLDLFAVDWKHTHKTVDAETAAKLQALGYASGSMPITQEGPLHDPSTRIGLLNRVHLAQGQMKSDPDAAERQLRAVLQEDPTLIDGWYSIATLHVNRGRADQALQAIDRILALNPSHAIALDLKLLTLRGDGRIDEALVVARSLADANPRDPRRVRQIIDLLGRKEDPAAVLAEAQRGLKMAPRDPYLHYMAGVAAMQVGDHAAVLTYMQGARTHGSRAEDIDLWQGKALHELGRLDEAGKALEAQARATPTDPRPLQLAVRMYLDADNCDAAVPLMLKLMEVRGKSKDLVEAYRECGGVGM